MLHLPLLVSARGAHYTDTVRCVKKFLKLSSCSVAVICNEGAHLTGLKLFVKPFIFALPGGFRCYALPSRGAHYTDHGTAVKTYFQMHYRKTAPSSTNHGVRDFLRTNPNLKPGLPVRICASRPGLQRDRALSKQAPCRSPFLHLPLSRPDQSSAWLPKCWP